MNQPLDFTLHQITCFATHDYTGDDLIAKINPVELELGSFDQPAEAGQHTVKQLGISQIVPQGEIYLFIENRNTLSVNDQLAVIDLTTDYSIARAVTITKDDAHYELLISVNYAPTVIDTSSDA